MIGTKKSFAVWIYLLITPIGFAAQSPPDLTFGGHTLGEPADVFFATARVSGSKQMATDYCKSLLEDPRTKEKVAESIDVAKNGGVFVLNQKDFSALDVGNCRQVAAALRGEQANVGSRLASELGKGFALFARGRLSAFNLTVDSSYAETASDLERRFGAVGQKDAVVRIGWPALHEERWERDGILAAVWKDKYSDGAVVIVGILELPYESFLRGTLVPESSLQVSSSPDCKASDSTRLVQASSGVMAGLILHRVQAVYPDTAKQSRIQGMVELDATIDECGHVVDLKPISGPSELVPAAMTAVKQWEYRPYMSSGQPVAVETRVRVNFTLLH
jgi:TonB family protein